MAWGLLSAPPDADADIQRTKHNLSAGGPGTVKSSQTSEVCVFCHTPHNANPSRALWNQELSGTTYTLYTSSTLEATLGQPTGSSRLCLSCHDGTVALGALRKPPSDAAVTMAPLAGRAALGTDLSDDHPISFVYDSALAIRQGALADPATLPAHAPLDNTGQLQCTSCHDPHDDTYRQFLRADDRRGALCTTCHQVTGWTTASHATSTAAWSGAGANPWPGTGYTTVAENACYNCHRPHTAPRPPRLLSNSQEPEVCLVCHNGGVARTNLEPEFLKMSSHPIRAAQWTHDPTEQPSTMSRHVACADCHNPHQAEATPAEPPNVSGRLRGVSGVNIAGLSVREAQYEYEVCLKCHGISDQATAGIVRQDNTRNVRLEIEPTNLSYHPVAAVGRNPMIKGLNPGYTASSIIRCTDCHNNDERATLGTAPAGPHGSRFEPILARRFEQSGGNVTESAESYALCYQCHNRDVLLSTEWLSTEGGFIHRKHLRDAKASCAVCHDPHGSRLNIRLVNFMLRDKNGQTVVGPNAQGVLQFVPTGAGHGACSLRCHDHEHIGLPY